MQNCKALKVWTKAAEATLNVRTISKAFPQAMFYSPTDQLRRHRF
jgi:hypothetical protein